ncbi:MAG TPA: hypothetical protein VFA21_20510 [Pyrinomonadaceae bacterium]|nr:hypothetical protein [Pyrinomonadaceae bacterium]
MSEKATPFDRPEGQPILRAMENARKGVTPDERCYFCGSLIHVEAGGAAPGGQPTSFRFTCRCGKSNGSFTGI